MPELSEVECARKLVEDYCAGKVVSVVSATQDDKVLEGAAPDDLAQALQGRKLSFVSRRGKYLVIEFEPKGLSIVMHFGMTGSLLVKGVAAAKYVGVNADAQGEWPPKFWKLVLIFNDGTELGYTDPRRFGRVKLQHDPFNSEPLTKLGFDPLLSMPGLDEFQTKLSKYKTQKIKALLLDQSFSAGVGNWIADEVLYHSRIHPECPVCLLDADSIKRLHESLSYVVKTAVDLNADSDKFPRDWLFHYRWTGQKASSVNGQKIDFVKVGSRTSAYVPALQKLPSKAATAEDAPKRSRKGNNTCVPVADAVDTEAKPKAKRPRGTASNIADGKPNAQAKRKSQKQAEVGADDDEQHLSTEVKAKGRVRTRKT